MSKLRFVHLSDIHFSSKSAGFEFDPDRELRSRVKLDVEQQCGRLGPASAILVSGDVAYAGKQSEYEDAARWLDELCQAACCPVDEVYVCAGNHDVDHDVLKTNPVIGDAYEAVRRGRNLWEWDTNLNSRLAQDEAVRLFYAPLAEYNLFAGRYECSFFADQKSFVWEHDFDLNDGSTLRLRGVNSALLSGPTDERGKLFLGSRAWTLHKEMGVEYMIMCHHPPSWLLDGREAERSFESEARIQLFGHEHDQRALPGRDMIKLFAGAVNPHRAERNWSPGYNIIEVHVDEGEGRRMVVEVHAREWQGHPAQFRSLVDANEKPVFRVSIGLPDLPERYRHRPEAAARVQEAMHETSQAAGQESMPSSATAKPRFRGLVHRFFRLSASDKNEVIGTLNLAEERDDRLPGIERHKIALARARDAGRLDELEQQIQVAEARR